VNPVKIIDVIQVLEKCKKSILGFQNPGQNLPTLLFHKQNKLEFFAFGPLGGEGWRRFK
jgi:hypothetical protein